MTRNPEVVQLYRVRTAPPKKIKSMRTKKLGPYVFLIIGAKIAG
jgi:hypothetical protein